MSLNYFELFDLHPIFNVEPEILESNYRKIQSEAHPDRFVTAPAAEKLKSMQLATLANEAYLTLKNPANRAKYLLELQGITAISETNTAMPAEFLMQQMEWRETLEDATTAKNIESLENLLSEIQIEAKSLQSSLVKLLDEEKDYTTATDATRKLIFIEKVCADIHKAIEQIEN
ncbi:Fe-S protein assembly co-chaperone HscB [Methylotenera sp.]|uniref:Fe-S protein assembly co-chaperone HscB n=1 Tax=Methylotenera sp. TaxID=2051956 RepID=UPI002730C5AD|nr:Fe-S protein assembly co-chaperone HscB [Methylotenera sp.]MDP2231209.1 Fe-S protein assembly co-chaperone HscB [Methylotenera sp.]MDP3140065.1 Fe-S protein assembly co-chaperone HscB [Methylotenera sp.]